ncbi:MAG: type IV secretory system conjugative DNA transfer family protein [Clostridia bacterium]|nr:type IV secretory system conjugative DNA transfer family protein [Clostridia bacterium]
MRKFFEEFKKNAPVLIVLALIASVVFGGALTKSITDAKEAGSDSLLFDVIQTFLGNITNMGFFAGMFSDFILFLQITFWIFVAVFGIYIFTKIQSNSKSEYEGKENGSSSWSNGSEDYMHASNGKEILNRKEGFILSKRHYLGTDLKKVGINKNILVVGGSGAGKTACYIKPNIMQCLGSYVITDPKGELYKETSKFLEQEGYEIKAFNLVNPKYSDFYNPIANICSDQDVDTLAHILVTGANKEGGGDDPFWDNTAKMLISATIYYVLSVLPLEEQNIGSCLNIIRQGGADSSIFEKLFIDDLKPEHPGRIQYESFKTAADKTMQSIVISSISKMRVFDMPAIQRITSSNSIDFRNVAKKKTAIYVITSAAESTYDFVSTMFFSQMFSILYKQADDYGSRLPNQVYFLLDEFANVGQIPDFQKKLSTTRSLGISISIIVQSLDQLESLYKDSYENILGNCDTQLLLGTNSQKTAEYFSKSLGQTTIKIEQKSISKDKSEQQKQGVSISTQRQARDLMTVDEIRRLDNNKEIIMVRGLKPILAEKAWYFECHPKRNIIEPLKIGSITDMPVPKPVPYRYFDVQQYLANRKRRAQEILKARSKDVDIDSSSLNASTSKAQPTAGKEPDIQIDMGKSAKPYDPYKVDRGPEIDNSPLAEGMESVSYNDLYENNDNSPIAHVSKKSDKNDEFDLQSELESKFDKLFGKPGKKNNDDF